MATEGPRFPGTTANLSNAGTSENANAWLTPGNIVSDNATEAQITAATYDSPDISEILVASNFGFTVPDGSTVLGITVEIDRRSIIASSGKDFRVQLAKGTAFANLVGSNKAVSATIWPTTSAVASYGGASDLWGTTWTPAEIRASSFALFLSAQANIANADVGVDFVRITVAYTPPAVTGTGDPIIDEAVLDATGTVVVAVSGTGAITADEAALAASGAEAMSGSGAITADEAAVAASGAESMAGTGAITADEAVLAGTGAQADSGVTGSGAIVLDEAVVAASGSELIVGSGALAMDEIAMAGSGAELILGPAALVLDESALSAVGLVVVPVSGDGAIAVDEAIVAAVGIGGRDPVAGDVLDLLVGPRLRYPHFARGLRRNR